MPEALTCGSKAAYEPLRAYCCRSISISATFTDVFSLRATFRASSSVRTTFPASDCGAAS